MAPSHQARTSVTGSAATPLVEGVDRLSDLETPHQGFEQSGHLQAGEMHAGAHVRAIAESQVIRGSPLHVEAFRFLPLALVAVGGRI